MTSGRVAIIAGNGLTIDFVQAKGLAWDTSAPLGWELRTPGEETTPLLRSLPRFRDVVENLRNEMAGISDFQVFDEIVRQLPAGSFTHVRDWDDALLATETRHFLGLAYSEFQQVVDSVSFEGWGWYEYLASLRQSLIGAVSFNYDVLLERALTRAGHTVRGFGVVNDPADGVWVGKPHGSIDYETHDIAVGPVCYPLTKAVLANDTQIRRLNASDLHQPRTQIELVPPQAASEIVNFQWVRPAFEEFAAVGPTLDRLLIVGLSYSEADRPEINCLLKCLSSSTRVVIANPHPPAELVKAVRHRGIEPETWTDGPPVL